MFWEINKHDDGEFPGLINYFNGHDDQFVSTQRWSHIFAHINWSCKDDHRKLPTEIDQVRMTTESWQCSEQFLSYDWNILNDLSSQHED